MKVRDIMTTSVASLSAEDTVVKAASIMKEHNVGSVPVCQGSNVVGIITDRDITLKSVASGVNSNSQSVREVMSSNPVVGSPDMSLEDASRIMSEQQIRRLPIVENQKLVGVIALGDLAVEPKSDEKAGNALSSISQPTSQQ